MSCLNEKKESDWLKVLGGLAIITFYFGYLWRTELNFDGYNLVNFIFLYMIGRYLKVKNNFFRKILKRSYMIGTYIICTLITALLGIFLLVYKESADYIFYWAWRYNSPIVILGSIALFLFFNSLTFCNKWINFIAASTFSVYLIHENYHVKYLIYDKVGESLSKMNIIIMILYLIVFAMIILTGGIIIDFVRRCLVDKLFKRMCNHLNRYIDC